MSNEPDFFKGDELEFAIYISDPAHSNYVEPDSIYNIFSKSEFIAFARDVYNDDETIQGMLNNVIFDNTVDMALEVISHCASYNIIVGSGLKDRLDRN